MMCYQDRSFCVDACLCKVPEKECQRKLTKVDGDRASSLDLPIAWMSFKDHCNQFKAING